jgi:hypothetical protein
MAVQQLTHHVTLRKRHPIITPKGIMCQRLPYRYITSLDNVITPEGLVPGEWKKKGEKGYD